MFLPTTAREQVVFIFLFSLFRYVLFAGIAFCVFYILLKRKKIFYKIQQRWPSGKGLPKRDHLFLNYFFVFCNGAAGFKPFFCKTTYDYLQKYSSTRCTLFLADISINDDNT
jgi:hypothetical protein